ncbi:MAG TPA: DUF6795 domain-containing protein [Limnobacter sp.]|nr:DUF6795 domain-containing protein [Limnobacter sp.]
MNRLPTKPRLQVLVLCLFLFLPLGACGMYLDNLILCSPVEGQILDDGKPVAGLKVQRRILWNVETEAREDFATTDSQGRFGFSEVRVSHNFTWLSKYLHMPSVGIELNLMDSDGEYVLTYLNRNSYKPGAELGLPIIQMTCDKKNKQVIGESLQVIKCEIQRV